MITAATNVGVMAIGTYAPMAPFSLQQLAGTVSKLSLPLFVLYALSNAPAAEAKKHPVFTNGKSEEDGFVACMNACDKIEAEIIKFLCYAGCGVIDLFKKKEK